MSLSLADLKKARLILLGALVNVSRQDAERTLRVAGINPGPQVIG